MNYIDIIICIILFLSMIGGYKNGLIAELASIAALILGIWGSIHFSGTTSELLVRYFNVKSEYLHLIAFGVTFAVIVILVHVVASVVSNLADFSSLGVINKIGGVLIGLFRSLLFLSITLMIFDRIDRDVNIIPEKAKSGSRMYEPVRDLAPSIFPFIDIWDENPDWGKLKDDKTT